MENTRKVVRREKQIKVSTDSIVKVLRKIPNGKKKYSPEILKLVEDYVNNVASEGKNHLPKVESLALYIGVERKTLYNWAKSHPELKACLKWIKELQYERLIDDGIYGGKSINGALVKLILVSNHKLRDEIGVGLSGEVTTKFSDEQIKRIADRITRRSGNNGGKSSEE